MRTVLAATAAALLAAAITATAANQGEPVKDAAAIKQLKQANRHLADQVAEIKRQNTILWGDNDPHRFDNAGDALDNIAFNIYAMCWRQAGIDGCSRPGLKPSP